MAKKKTHKGKKKNYITSKEKWGFAIGGCGQGMIYAMMSSYISDYYVNVLHLPLMFVLLLMLLARVWDAINDPLMGILADKHTTKRGKLKPYILYAAAPIALFTILMYLSPNLEPTALMVYSAIVYVGWGMLYTMADVPFWGLPNIMTPKADERGHVLSFGKTINGIGSAVPEVLFLICGFLIPRLFAGSDALTQEKRKYLLMAIVTVGIGIVLYTRTYFKVKERVIIPPKTRKPGEPSTLSRLFKCKPLMLVVAMGVLSSGRYMVQAAAIHVARYGFYIGPNLATLSADERITAISQSVSTVKTIFQICAIVGMFGAMLFMPALMKKFQYHKIVITTCLLGFASSIFTTLIGWFAPSEYSLYICIPFIIISCIPLGVLNNISIAMIGDCLDYMELKTGFRDNALGAACQGFVNKLGNAFATCGIVLMYMFIDIDPAQMLSSTAVMAATDLTRTQNFAMFSLVSIVPGISMLLCAIPMFFYKIDEIKPEMQKELTIMRKKSGVKIEN